jgi:hypothetical protein
MYDHPEFKILPMHLLRRWFDFDEILRERRACDACGADCESEQNA